MIKGDRVRKRGFKHEGKIVKMDTTWMTIEWDDGPMPIERPVMCHIRELEAIEDAVEEYNRKGGKTLADFKKELNLP